MIIFLSKTNRISSKDTFLKIIFSVTKYVYTVKEINLLKVNMLNQ